MFDILRFADDDCPPSIDLHCYHDPLGLEDDQELPIDCSLAKVGQEDSVSPSVDIDPLGHPVPP